MKTATAKRNLFLKELEYKRWKQKTGYEKNI